MKRIVKPIIAGVCLGIVLFIIGEIMHVNWHDYLCGVWLVAIVVCIASVLFDVCYSMFYQRKIQRIVPLLADGRPEEYIAQMDALLQTARGRNLHNVLLINLSAGYFTAKQYETAIEILEPLEKERLVGYSVKLCHRINLCTNYFYAGRCEQALAYYQSNQKLFSQYQNHKLYGGHIAEIDILAAMQCGQYEQAKTLLADAKRTWTDPLLQEAFAAIEKTLDEING